MPTAPEVRAQIKAIPTRYIFFTGKEIRALPDLLAPEEYIRGITSGMMDSDTWLAVCTTKRVLFVNRGMIYGLRQVQIPLDRIQSVDHEYGLFFGSIRIWDTATCFTMRMVLRRSILPFVRTVQEEMKREKKESKVMTIANFPASPPTEPTDVPSQLERLATLREKGVITEEEFQAQKKKMLS